MKKLFMLISMAILWQSCTDESLEMKTKTQGQSLSPEIQSSGDGPGFLCNAPSNFTVVKTTTSSARLKWSPVLGADHYIIEYKKASALVWSAIVVSGSTEKLLPGLSSSTDYLARISTVCAAGISSSLATIDFHTYCVSKGLTTDHAKVGELLIWIDDPAAEYGFSTVYSRHAQYDEIGGYNLIDEGNLNLFKGLKYWLIIRNTFDIVDGHVGKEYGFRAWIDYNADGDFSDQGELILSEIGTRSNPNGPAVGSHSVVPPATAKSGKTLMRVAVTYNESSPFLSEPCEIFLNGAVNDYVVNISSLNL
jgi:hypothetical protein